MGTLKPGANYIYERDNGVVYARESSAQSSDRFEIGRDYKTDNSKSLHDQILEDKLWGEIRRAAKTNLALGEELERVKTLYYLIKENNDSIMWHPV